MRLWSLHPCYLDAKGLTALWREGLLARAVLSNRTKGYRHHPQLMRFKDCEKPVATIDCYLAAVYAEAEKRGYHFDAHKLGRRQPCAALWVTVGQLEYEWAHLLEKLKKRAPEQYQKWQDIPQPQPHPLFRVKPGKVEPWERITER